MFMQRGPRHQTLALQATAVKVNQRHLFSSLQPDECIMLLQNACIMVFSQSLTSRNKKKIFSYKVMIINFKEMLILCGKKKS